MAPGMIAAEPSLRPSVAMTVRQLRDVLRADILSDLHGPGDRLPAEAELMRLLGASRTSVRAALDLLREEGLIERVPGAGTSVLTTKASHGLDRLRGLGESFGPEAGRVVNEVLSAQIIPSPRMVSDRLQLAAGDEVVLIERVRHLDGKPLSLDISYLPADLARPLLDVDLTSNDVFVVLDGPLGLRLGAARLSIEAIRADASVARLLALPSGSPLLMVDRLTHLEDGRPIDLEFLRYRGDRLTLTTWLIRRTLESP